jgi:hypothetical protein
LATLLATTGYGSTGSSAATNILEEFKDVKSLGNEEFTFAHEPDGIADLEDSLHEGHRLKTDLAVKRFLLLSRQLASGDQYKKHFNGKFAFFADEYINSIIKCKWDGWWHRAFETRSISAGENFRFRLAEQLFNWRLGKMEYNLYEPDNWFPNYKPVIENYYGNITDKNEENEFIKHTKSFTDKLIQEENAHGNFKYILLDQAIPPILPSKYSRYFTRPKTIIIDRDPRDLYVINKSLWGVGFIPSASVEMFIDWFKATRKMCKKELIHIDDLLFLSFESLIYNYDISLEKIYNFIDLPEKYHVNKLKRFNPDLSRRNTQVFLQYPDLFSDIKRIENELEEYCYAFPNQSQEIPKKYFLIETINTEVLLVQHNGVLPPKYRKHTLYMLFRLTYLHLSFYSFFKELKKRKGLSLAKLFIKSSAKIVFSFLIFPVNLLIIFLSYFIFKKKEVSI